MSSLAAEAKQRLIKSSVSSVEEDFIVYWHKNDYDSCLVVNATDVFSDFTQSVKGGQRTEILTNLGCRKFTSGSSIKIRGTQSRSWWITSAGLTAGMKQAMNGAEVGEFLECNLSSITQIKYDSENDEVEITKQCTGF